MAKEYDMIIVVLSLIIVTVFGLIIGVILGIPTGIVTAIERKKETDELIKAGKPRICKHCMKEVDPKATTCPYCRKSPFA